MEISSDANSATSEGHVMAPPPPEPPDVLEPPVPGSAGAALTVTVALAVGLEPPVPVHRSA